MMNELNSNRDTHAVADMLDGDELGAALTANLKSGRLDNLVAIRDEITNRIAGIDHFGVCPQCWKTDGYVNVGKGHWFYCSEHRVTWFAGANIFSTWQLETEDEQRAQYEELGLGDFVHVEPRHAARARDLALVR